MCNLGRPGSLKLHEIEEIRQKKGDVCFDKASKPSSTLVSRRLGYAWRAIRAKCGRCTDISSGSKGIICFNNLRFAES